MRSQRLIALFSAPELRLKLVEIQSHELKSNLVGLILIEDHIAEYFPPGCHSLVALRAKTGG